MHSVRLLSFLGGAAAVAVALHAAHADTRIFSVQTDRDGVTVTAIERDGEALEQVGQSGARTFFEIDQGNETVPCSNQLSFTTSNDQRLEYIVDLCAHNWQVTLPVGVADIGPGGQSPGTVPGSLTIYTNDDNVGIEEVYIDRQPVTVAGRQENAVAVALPSAGDPEKCERDIGLVLDDGRRIARLVDVCTPDGVIVITLNESDSSSAPPKDRPPITIDTPSAPPPAAPSAPPPTASPSAASSPPPTASPAEIEVIEGLTWVFGRDGSRVVLTYATAESDQIEFYASCNRGDQQAEVSLERSAPEIRPGASATATFTAGTYAGTFTATGSEVNALTGESQPEVTIATDDPFWTALIREEFLVVQIGSATPYALSLKGSSAAARPFVDACKSAADVAGPPAPPGLPATPDYPSGPAAVGATTGDYPCSGEATLSAQRTNIESRLIVRNQSGRSIQLYWIDYDGNRRPFLSLGPGESGVQPTFFTHPWVVADSSGRCLAIYYARNTDRQIVVGR